jgi:chemotaxis receptor (MCP) glutamine deamidase CheD
MTNDTRVTPARACEAASQNSQKGIPTVGLYTGAGAPKSEAEAKLFGGAAGRPLDPCYHRGTENIDQEVLEHNTPALVRVLGCHMSGTQARKLARLWTQAIAAPVPGTQPRSERR